MWVRWNDATSRHQWSDNDGANWYDMSHKLPLADGTVGAPSLSFTNDPDTGFYLPGAGVIGFTSGGIDKVKFYGGQVDLVSTYILSWNNDTYLQRDGAGILALKNGANPQELRIYGTTVGPKYGGLQLDTAGNMIFKASAGNPCWYISSSGHFLSYLDDTFNIGSPGANRPKHYYGSGDMVIGGNLTVSHTTTPSNISLDTNAGYYRGILFRTGTSQRWYLVTSNGAESGSNAGSNFEIHRYDDAGTWLGLPFMIYRSSGNAVFTNYLTSNTCIRARNSSDQGYVDMLPGDASNMGYIAWRKADTTRLGYMGFGNTDIQLVLENSANFVVSSAVRPAIIIYDGGVAWGRARLMQHSNAQLAQSINANYNGTGWDLDDTGNNGIFHRLALTGHLWRALSAGTNPRTPTSLFEIAYTGIINAPLNCYVTAYSSVAATSVTASTWTSLAFNQEADDTQGLHDTVTNNSRITIPTGGDGKYVIDAQIECNGTNLGGQDFGIRILKGGATVIAKKMNIHGSSGNNPTILHLTAIAKLAAGDYIELQYFTSTASAQWVGGAQTNSYLTVAKIH